MKAYSEEDRTGRARKELLVGEAISPSARRSRRVDGTLRSAGTLLSLLENVIQSRDRGSAT